MSLSLVKIAILSDWVNIAGSDVALPTNAQRRSIPAVKLCAGLCRVVARRRR
jgi:hypothetical protein